MVVTYDDYIKGLNGDNPQSRLDSLRAEKAIDRETCLNLMIKICQQPYTHHLFFFSLLSY